MQTVILIFIDNINGSVRSPYPCAFCKFLKYFHVCLFQRLLSVFKQGILQFTGNASISVIYGVLFSFFYSVSKMNPLEFFATKDELTCKKS